MRSRNKLAIPERDRLQLEFGVDFDEFTLAHHGTTVEPIARSFVRDWLDRRQLLDRVDVKRFTEDVLAEAKGRHEYVRRVAQHHSDLVMSRWLQELSGIAQWATLLAASVNRRRAHLAAKRRA